MGFSSGYLMVMFKGRFSTENPNFFIANSGSKKFYIRLVLCVSLKATESHRQFFKPEFNFLLQLKIQQKYALYDLVMTLEDMVQIKVLLKVTESTTE